MNDFLIKNYISRITIEDIKKKKKKHNIELSKEELKLIEQHIKNDWKTIIYGNPKPILDNLKEKLNQEKYQKIENLYIEFKDKYKHYL